MSVIFLNEKDSEAKIHVQSSWAGNAVTGQLVKEFIHETGSVRNLTDHLRHCTVTVYFPVQLLILNRMRVGMIAAVLEDILKLESTVRKLTLIWE